ncbi:hypothetical protein [Clostridium sp. ZS1]|uniref:hypothetical protein n=1 Tax=Clostridium sp. ZS1 TaxID=2949989 RepID=UPI0020799B66|nr:hypothetical protein [Clostridium sp. ZS1]
MTEIKITHDGIIKIAVGKSKSKIWRNKDLKWSEFVEKLSKTYRTKETVQEYKGMSKSEKGRAKEVKGGFIGGKLKKMEEGPTVILNQEI